MAQRDESFNEFLRNFKAKNEQKWANIIDATQDEQEEILLNKSPEYRRNEMIMLEEFRRRKNMKEFHDAQKQHNKAQDPLDKEWEKEFKAGTPKDDDKYL